VYSAHGWSRARPRASPVMATAHASATGLASMFAGAAVMSVQGLIAAGRNPSRVRRAGSRTPIAYLRSLVTPSGAVRYSRTSAQTPVWVTAQALVALAGKAFPLAPARAASPALASAR